MLFRSPLFHDTILLYITVPTFPFVDEGKDLPTEPTHVCKLVLGIGTVLGETMLEHLSYLINGPIYSVCKKCPNDVVSH